MARIRETIDKVLEGDLCTGCGTCAGICPKSAIEMTIDERKGIYVPELVEIKCNQCGICFDVCPGRFGDLGKLNLELFGKESGDILLGNYIGCFLAHATDYGVRYNSASGGLVTSLLILALEQRIIDGALVTKMSEENPLRPDVYIARTKEEIISASKSKYCPVPANVALKEILKQDGKFAVVGLPCHIHGIRKAELADNKLKEKIALHLGIFCSHTVSFKGTEFLLYKFGLEEENVAKLSYRGGGWPGRIQIILTNGTQKCSSNQSPLWNTIFNSFFFTPARCLLCQDITNELADISFGDAWLPEIMATEHEGKSVVISRSEHGEALLHRAKSKGEIEISVLDFKDVIRSQRTFLHFKKVNLEARIWLWKLFGRESPYAEHKTKTSLYNKVVALLPLFNSCLGQRLGLVPVLKHMPTRMVGIYISAFYRLYSRAIRIDFSKLLKG